MKVFNFGSKGCLAIATLLRLLCWPLSLARSEDKVVPVERAIAILEHQEARIERAQWTVQAMSGRLTNASDRKTATFQSDTPFQSTTIIEPMSGRYRCDMAGIAEWIDGVTSHIGYRHSYSFDGQQQREYELQKPGSQIPMIGQLTGRGTITGEHRGAFMKEKGTLAGAWHFPPYSFGMKLSDLLKERLRRKSPLQITEDAQGRWTINTDANQPQRGEMLQIFYDPARGAETGARWVTDVSGKPGKLWKELYIELFQTEKGFWIPRQIDYVNITDKTIDRQLYSDVKVNHPVTDDMFRFAFPLKTQITDELEGKRYMVGEGAVNDEAAVLAYAHLHGLRLDEDSPDAPSVPFWRGPFVRILLMIIPVILIGAILLLRWRRRKGIVRDGLPVLILALLPLNANAAELNERGEWLVQYGKEEPIRMSQCGLNITVMTLACFGLHYNLRQVAEALPPTEEGIRFGDIQAVLEASGLKCIPRQKVDMATLKAALRPNMMAIFAVPGPNGYNHYLAVINHPRLGCLLLDPPHRQPSPLGEAVAAPHLQPLSGLVLFIGRERHLTPQARRVSLSPDSFDLGAFSTTDADASKPYRRTLTLTNKSQLPVLITRVSSACGCVTAEWRGGVVRAGETRQVPFMIINSAWGKGRIEKKITFVFADNSETDVTWTGEGLSAPEIQRLGISSDALRIDLDAHSSMGIIERTVRVWLDGAKTDELQVTCPTPWLTAVFKPSDSRSGMLHIQIRKDKLQIEPPTEGRIMLTTRGDKSPALIKVFLSRSALWQAAQDTITISRGEREPRKARVVHRGRISSTIQSLRLVDLPNGLDVKLPAQPSETVVALVRATSSSALGFHILKVAITDEQGKTSTVSFLVHVVE